MTVQQKKALPPISQKSDVNDDARKSFKLCATDVPVDEPKDIPHEILAVIDNLDMSKEIRRKHEITAQLTTIHDRVNVVKYDP